MYKSSPIDHHDSLKVNGSGYDMSDRVSAISADEHHHVRTPAEQRNVSLQEIDNAKFSWRAHGRVAALAGVGFFTDAYDIFAINIASQMLGYVYGSKPTGSTCHVNTLSAHQEFALKVATPVGNLVGQLLFGFLADLVGRRRMYGVELVIIVSATFVQALSGNGGAINILRVLTFWRFVMGVGIGGDYPLSAIIASEFSPTMFRGRIMAAVFATQGLGTFVASLIAMIVTISFKTSISDFAGDTSTSKSMDTMWRILIGLGCVPGVIALYFRFTVPESPRFRMDIEGNLHRATADIDTLLRTGRDHADDDPFMQRIDVPRASIKDFNAYFRKPENFKILFGTAYSWFALDIAFYGLGLNSAIIYNNIAFTSTPPKPADPTGVYIYKTLKNACAGSLVISASLMLGNISAFSVIDRFGRRLLQLIGFVMLTIMLIIISASFKSLIINSDIKNSPGNDTLIFLLCLANFFQNFGPNTTTFVIPAEVFPTRYRSTGNGISAASGKLGAIIAQVIFFFSITLPNTSSCASGDSKSISIILGIFAVFTFSGILSTWFLVPEPQGKTLEYLSNEPQVGFVRSRPEETSLITQDEHDGNGIPMARRTTQL